VSIDCSFRDLDLFSLAGPFRLPPFSTLQLKRCNINTFLDSKAASALIVPLGPSAPHSVFGGFGTEGATIKMFSSTLRWFDAVCSRPVERAPVDRCACDPTLGMVQIR
jgi:hypothetical protein